MSGYIIQLTVTKKMPNSEEGVSITSMIDGELIALAKFDYLMTEYTYLKLAIDLEIEKKLRPSEWDL